MRTLCVGRLVRSIRTLALSPPLFISLALSSSFPLSHRPLSPISLSLARPPCRRPRERPPRPKPDRSLRPWFLRPTFHHSFTLAEPVPRRTPQPPATTATLKPPPSLLRRLRATSGAPSCSPCIYLSLFLIPIARYASSSSASPSPPARIYYRYYFGVRRMIRVSRGWTRSLARTHVTRCKTCVCKLEREKV